MHVTVDHLLVVLGPVQLRQKPGMARVPRPIRAVLRESHDAHQCECGGGVGDATLPTSLPSQRQEPRDNPGLLLQLPLLVGQSNSSKT